MPRLDPHFRSLPIDLSLVLSPHLHVKLQLADHYYEQPKVLSNLRRFLPPEFQDKFYRQEAGAYDQPKFTLLNVALNQQHTEVTLTLGQACYYDIFYTHYAPDLDLTPDEAPSTLRQLIGIPLDHHYARQLRSDRFKPCLEPSPLLTNALGTTSIVLLPDAEGEVYTLMQMRGGENLEARGQLDWASCGLVESLPFLHVQDLSFKELMGVEYKEEVLDYLPALRGKSYDIAPLGLVLNPTYLYQPEIFATVSYAPQDADTFAAIQQQLPSHLRLIKLKELPGQLTTTPHRNTIPPVLAFLRKVYPALFKA